MDENNSMNFSFEPMGEDHASQQAAPSGNPKKPEKNGKITGKIVALLLVVAVLGSVGGSALTGANIYTTSSYGMTISTRN